MKQMNELTTEIQLEATNGLEAQHTETFKNFSGLLADKIWLSLHSLVWGEDEGLSRVGCGCEAGPARFGPTPD